MKKEKKICFNKFVIYIFFIIFVIINFGCNNAAKENKKYYYKNLEKEEMDNPSIIYGSDFMSFMKSLRMIGDYKKMLLFTYSGSIKKFGYSNLQSFYENKFTNMSYIKLKSIVDNEDGTKTMNYINYVHATKKASSVDVIIENDTCKLIIKDLNGSILN